MLHLIFGKYISRTINYSASFAISSKPKDGRQCPLPWQVIQLLVRWGRSSCTGRVPASAGRSRTLGMQCDCLAHYRGFEQLPDARYAAFGQKRFAQSGMRVRSDGLKGKVLTQSVDRLRQAPGDCNRHASSVAQRPARRAAAKLNPGTPAVPGFNLRCFSAEAIAVELCKQCKPLHDFWREPCAVAVWLRGGHRCSQHGDGDDADRALASNCGWHFLHDMGCAMSKTATGCGSGLARSDNPDDYRGPTWAPSFAPDAARANRALARARLRALPRAVPRGRSEGDNASARAAAGR